MSEDVTSIGMCFAGNKSKLDINEKKKEKYMCRVPYQARGHTRLNSKWVREVCVGTCEMYSNSSF